MKKDTNKITVAVIGSDGMEVIRMQKYIPNNTNVIVTGVSNEVDESARDYAFTRSYGTTLFMPLYDENGQELPLKRIEYMVESSDMVVAFWDGKSEDIRYAVKICKKRKIPIKVYIRDWVETKKFYGVPK